MEQETRTDGRRALPAVAVALAVIAVAALAGSRGCLRTPEADEVAARHVEPPGARTPRPEPERSVARGETAPRLVLPDLEGTKRDLASWRGRVIVLNVWASWCAPCVREMPSLQRLHEVAGEDVAVVTVSVDDERTAARALAERVGLTAPVLLDAGGDALAGWGTVKYPETWILDPEGRVVERVIGERDWSGADVQAFLARVAEASGTRADTP